MSKDFYDLENYQNSHSNNSRDLRNYAKESWNNWSTQNNAANVKKPRRDGHDRNRSAYSQREDFTQKQNPELSSGPKVYLNENRAEDIDIMPGIYNYSEISNSSNKANEYESISFNEPSKNRNRSKLYDNPVYRYNNKAKAPAVSKVSNEKKGEKSKSQAKRTNNILATTVFVVLLFFVALIFLLYKQSTVMEVNYQNAALKSQISELDKENAERKVKIARSIDLNKIREQASAMGYHEPMQQQIVEVERSDKDDVVIFKGEANAAGVTDNDIDMDLVIENIEEYIVAGNKEKAEQNDAAKSENKIAATSGTEQSTKETTAAN